MAVVGDILLTPETGWRRYDDSDNLILKTGTWQTDIYASNYNGSCIYTPAGTVSFSFIGTKLRILGTTYSNQSSSVTVNIDGVDYYYNASLSSTVKRCSLLFEKIDLLDGYHIINISNNTSTDYTLDAIDIDSTSELIYSTGKEVTNLADMQIGDMISCEYNASTGIFGTFGNLGSATKDLIPTNSSATPDGKFYFIHTGYDHLGRIKLIADRNIQHSISWDKLNEAGIVGGENEVQIPLVDSQTYVPIHSDNTSNIGEVIYSSQYTSYYGWKAYDGQKTGEPNRWAAMSSNTLEWIGYRFNVLTSINLVEITSKDHSDRRADPNNFNIEGSNNGVDWTVLKSYSGITWTQAETKRFQLDEVVNMQYYRIKWTVLNADVGGGRYYGIQEIQFKKHIAKDTGRSFPMRLLSGGVSSTDKDNEWDKIIAEYDLNNTAITGHTLLWNWNGVGSWTSSTPTTGNTYRAIRGNSSVIARIDNQVSSAVSTTIGFRPVLLIPPGVYLPIVSFNNITYNQNIDIIGLVELVEGQFDIRYRYVINGVSHSWSSFTSNTALNISIPYNLLDYGINTIAIEVEDSSERTTVNSIKVYRELTTLLNPGKIYFNETNLNWLPILSLEKIDSLVLKKSDGESLQSINVIGNVYNDSNLQLSTSYTYKIVGIKNNIEVVESNSISIDTPSDPAYYYLWKIETEEYLLKLIEGIAFDSTEVDYDLYTTPNRIIIKPLILGDLIGGRNSNVFAFEVLNTYEDKNLTITLYATDANQNIAVPVDNYGEFQDSDNIDWRSLVVFDYDEGFTLGGFYPAIFELNAGQKKVVYCRFKPGIDAGMGQKVMYVIATTREVNFDE